MIIIKNIIYKDLADLLPAKLQLLISVSNKIKTAIFRIFSNFLISYIFCTLPLFESNIYGNLLSQTNFHSFSLSLTQKHHMP